MSYSSSTLKTGELEYLIRAQVQAASFNDYVTWVGYMRKTYSYALAVRMSLYLGCEKPGKDFYTKMLASGKQILREKNEESILSNCKQASGGRVGAPRSHSLGASYTLS